MSTTNATSETVAEDEANSVFSHEQDNDHDQDQDHEDAASRSSAEDADAQDGTPENSNVVAGRKRKREKYQKTSYVISPTHSLTHSPPAARSSAAYLPSPSWRDSITAV